MITLLTWNILHGGGARRAPWIALALIEQAPDLVVLTEFRPGRGGQIRGVLADHGLRHQAITPGGPGDNCVLIASRETIVCEPAPEHATVRRRWIEVDIRGLNLRLAGLHVPPPGPGSERARVWRQAVQRAAHWREERFVLLGDFNTGRAGPDGRWFRHTALLGKLATMGYTDSWRSLSPRGRQVTWRGACGETGRIDHCFLSRALTGELAEASIDESPMDRGVSDHALLRIRLHRAGEPAGALPKAPSRPPRGSKAVGKPCPEAKNPGKSGSKGE